MLIKDVFYTDGDFKMRRGNLAVVEGMLFENAPSDENVQTLELPENSTVLPGFIDIHTHGALGVDVCDADSEGYRVLSKYYASRGITSFCPTTMTESPKRLKKVFSAVADFMGKEPGAYIHGINMEGPYISREKKGAQNGDYIRKPCMKEFLALNKICPISIVDVAPEVEGALEFADRACIWCTVSAAHSNADGKTAREAFSGGFSHVTHMFNAMNTITARDPGIPGIVIDTDVTAELICDGFHVDPAVLRMVFSALGEDRVVAISDSMRSAGCKDGEYELGGQRVFVKDGHARLADGTIAASTANLFDEFLYLLDIAIPFETALRACTINPARIIGVSNVTGSIANGKCADLLILDKNFDICCVMVKGKVVYTNVK